MCRAVETVLDTTRATREHGIGLSSPRSFRRSRFSAIAAISLGCATEDFPLCCAADISQQL